MKKYLLLLLAFSLNLLAVDPDAAIMIDSASCNVRDAVHAPTGQAIIQRTDAVISGFEPIPVTRMYVSENNAALNWEGGWAIFPYTEFTLQVTDKGAVASIQEADGMVGRYLLEKGSYTLLPDLENSHSPPFNREISGRTDLRNNRLILQPGKKEGLIGATLYLGNGSKRQYRCDRTEFHPIRWVFLLEEEIKSNGNRVLYSYDKSGRIKEITTTNPGKTKQHCKLTFNYQGKKAKDRDCDLVGSDGTTLSYHFWRPEDKHIHDFFYFEEVSGAGIVSEKVLYDVGYKKDSDNHTVNKTRGPFVENVAIGEQNALKLAYYYPGHNKPSLWGDVFLKNARNHICDKVLDLQEPVGQDGSYITTHSFLYEHSRDLGPGVTKVKDILGNETHYYFDVNFKPSSIEFYTPNGLVRAEVFRWDGRNLSWHILKDPTNKNSIARHYEYDKRGNVTKQTLYGNLTGTCEAIFDIDRLGNGIESYSTWYEYSSDGFNLPIEKREENGLKITYSYKTGTDLLTAKIVSDQDKILTRHFYCYNEDHFLTAEIIDNGPLPFERKTIRYTPNQKNFPAIIEETGLNLSTGQEILLQKKILTYNAQNQIEKEEIYGSDQSFQYATQTKYESKLIALQTDPIGQKTTYAYNARQQLIQRHTEGSPVETFTYTAAGQLKEKKLIGEETQTSQFEYDLLGHKKSQTDPFGATTTFAIDRFGLTHKTTAPSIDDIERSTTSEYDFLGVPISHQDPNGDQTTIELNAYGKPTHILRQDGSEEHLVYTKNGALKQSIDPAGVATCYEYDILNRPLSKKVFSAQGSLLSTETNRYDSFHLRSQIDPLGFVTTIEYDAHGRKISETRENVNVKYRYDPLGRLNETIQEDLRTVTEQDLLGRITEERKESLQGKILYKKRFVYKDFGKLIEEITYPQNTEAITTTQLDSFGRAVKMTDPCGHTITYDYSLQPHAKTTTDALLRKQIETYNLLGSLAQLQKTDENGAPIAQENYSYDANGNLSVQTSQIYQGTTPLKSIQTRWVYGPLNRLAKWIEAANTPNARTTSYTYTTTGLLAQTIKPSGIILENTYDDLRHLTALQSSDGSIHYTYEPNALGLVVAATDQNTGLTTVRIPDAQGNILKESLANGFLINKSYDSFGRPKTCHFPDGSIVTKTYNPLYLETVSYSGLIHAYTQYDLAGNLLEESLPLNAGTVQYSVDLLSRTNAIHSSYHSQKIGSFNPIGKVESLHTTLPSSSNSAFFSYDALGQLVDDAEHRYYYDSHYNRLAKDDTPIEVDYLNRLESHVYDLDGNPNLTEHGRLSYDALDRLIAVDLPDQTHIEYTYDPLHRRLAKILPNETILYLYDGNNEIGFTQAGQLTLRILGATPQAEIDASIAIKQNGLFYIPLHDLQGSVSVLIDPLTLTAAEEHRYTPFGELEPTPSQNPWRYFSKHTDPETNLVFFGRRYYDPSAGRFLTLDPRGYTDSLNLYAYTLNDPFTLVDPYGLENELSQSNLGSITGSSARGISEGAWNGFIHPIDSMGGIAADLKILGSYTINGDFSTLLASWKAMDPEERVRFCSFQAARIAGIGASVYFAAGPILQGVKATLFASKALFCSFERVALTKMTASPIIETTAPVAAQSTTKSFILIGEGSLRTASVVRKGQTINRVFDSRHLLGRPYSQPWGGSFSPGSSLPNSASQAIIDRGLNWPGVINNAELGALYRANANVPCMVRTSLGGTAPEIEISREFKELFFQVGEPGVYTQIPR